MNGWLSKMEIMNAGKTGLFVGILGILVVQLLKWINVPHVTFAIIPDVNVRAQLESGVSSSLGNQILGYLGGILPTENLVGGIFAILLSSILIYVIGAQVLRWVTSKNFSPATSIALAGGLGSLVAAVILGPITGLLTLSFLSIFIALLLYFLVLGYLIVWLLPLIGVKRPDF